MNSTQVIKKLVPENNDFVERCFYRIRDTKDGDLSRWCSKTYGGPQYLGPWFRVSGYVVLDEKAYTYWKLCE